MSGIDIRAKRDRKNNKAPKAVYVPPLKTKSRFNEPGKNAYGPVYPSHPKTVGKPKL